MGFLRWTVTSVAVLGAVAFSGDAFAVAPPIRDHAQLFSLAALGESNEIAETIQTNYDKRLVIETFSSAPWTARLTHNFKDSQERARYLGEWAKRNARRAGSNGIYVLICKEPAPAEVEVRVGRDARPFFSLEDASRARDVLLADLRQGQHDTGLLRSVRLIESRLEVNGAHAPAPEEIFPWGRVFWSFLAIVVLWVWVQLVHHLAIGRSRLGNAEAEPVGFGGGGSLPAGLFAAMTSHWLRDLWRPGPVTEPYLQAKRVAVEEPHREKAAAEHVSNAVVSHAEELAGFDHQETHDKP